MVGGVKPPNQLLATGMGRKLIHIGGGGGLGTNVPTRTGNPRDQKKGGGKVGKCFKIPNGLKRKQENLPGRFAF